MLVHVAPGHGVCIAAATVAEHYNGDGVVFRPIADLAPFPLLVLTGPGRQRSAIDAFAALCATVATEQGARHGNP
jgi:hypothetical protein